MFSAFFCLRSPGDFYDPLTDVLCICLTFSPTVHYCPIELGLPPQLYIGLYYIYWQVIIHFLNSLIFRSGCRTEQIMNVSFSHSDFIVNDMLSLITFTSSAGFIGTVHTYSHYSVWKHCHVHEHLAQKCTSQWASETLTTLFTWVSSQQKSRSFSS